MKRIVALCLALVMALALTACGDKADPAPSGTTQQEQSSTAAPEGSSQTAESTPEVQEEQKKQPTDAAPELSPVTPTPELTAEQFDEIWTLLFGYWNAAEGRFAIFDGMDSNTVVFADGIWETSYSSYGTVSRLSDDYRADHENELTLSVYYHATEATDMEDAQPEKTQTVIIDYSGLEQDGKIRIKIGEDEWRQYMFAGQTEEEAYQTYADNAFPN